MNPKHSPIRVSFKDRLEERMLAFQPDDDGDYKDEVFMAGARAALELAAEEIMRRRSEPKCCDAHADMYKHDLENAEDLRARAKELS